LINLAGIFVRNATPTTGLGGDASRILLLRSEGLPLVRATAAFGYVRLGDPADRGGRGVLGARRRGHRAAVVARAGDRRDRRRGSAPAVVDPARLVAPSGGSAGAGCTTGSHQPPRVRRRDRLRDAGAGRDRRPADRR